MNRLVRRLLGRGSVPEGAVGSLDADEHVLAWAAVTSGGHLVATSHGIWFTDRESDPAALRRVGWHRVSKASWQGGAIVLVEADETARFDGAFGGVVVLADRSPRRLGLAEPGRVPQVVHERVTGSIRSRHHRDLPGGGAWFVQRRVAGADGFVLQVRPDPGTDPAVVRRLAADVAKQLPPPNSTSVLFDG